MVKSKLKTVPFQQEELCINVYYLDYKIVLL